MRNNNMNCHKCPNRPENIVSGEIMNFGSINTENNTGQNHVLNEPEIQTGSLKIVTQEDIGSLPETYQIGDIYMDLILNNPKNTQLLVNLSALQDIYTAGDGISIQDKVITNTKIVYWGELGGNLSDQTDLINALNSKCDTDLSNLPDSVWQKIKNYIVQITGNICTDSDILAQIEEMFHSTFDRSKFTPAGSPTITDNGIASGFGSGVVKVSTSISNYSSVNFKCRVIYTSMTADQVILYYNEGSTRIGITTSGYLYFTQGTGSSSIGSYILVSPSEGDILDIEATKLNGELSIKVIKNNNQIYTDSVSNSGITLGAFTTIWLGASTDASNFYFTGSIDLKQFSITVDGVPVFSGNKTGVDTYTINSQSVNIPYTLSKTGSKIVDSYYRTQINALAAQEGYALYYTLSDTDFTLPQGEIYGFISQNSADIKMLGAEKADKTALDDEWIYADETGDANLISADYAIGTYDVDLSSILPNDGKNYECIFCYCIDRNDNSNDNTAYTVTSGGHKVLEDNIDGRGGSSNDHKQHGGQFTAIIGVERKLLLSISNHALSNGNTRMYISAYRKLGTN